VNDLLRETIAKVGENITVSRFVRYVLGEAS
jgi:translation elongation factor EF-Ts